MGYVDYLPFVQTSALLNFAFMYWREKGHEDPIERLFTDSPAKFDFSKYEDLGEFDRKGKEVETWAKNLSKQDTAQAQAFFSKQEVFRNLRQQIADRVLLNNTRSHSLYFNYVCVFLGLYGILQWYLLPGVDDSNYMLNVYLFSTQAVFGVLCLFFYKEVHFMRCNMPVNNTYLGMSYWAFVAIFVVILLLSLFFPLYVQCIGFIIPLPEFWIDRFILLSFLLPYVSCVGYFLLNCYDFFRRIPKEKKKMDELLKNCLKIYAELKQIHSSNPSSPN